MTEALKVDVAEQLETGHDVAYTALEAAGVEVEARATSTAGSANRTRVPGYATA